MNLLIDGTYFANKLRLVLYRENNVKATLFYRLTDGEWEEELVEDLANIISLGVEIESVICDGLRNVIKAVKNETTNTVIQRYLAHIRRECLTWLTQRPQSDAGRFLRLIIKRLYTINNREKWGYWVVDLVHWYEQYKDFVNQKTFKDETGRYWFTHKSVRKALFKEIRCVYKKIHY